MNGKKSRKIRKAIERATGYKGLNDGKEKEREARAVRKEIFLDENGQFVAELNEDNEKEFGELYTKKELNLLKARSAIRGFKKLAKYGYKLKKQMKG